MAAWATEKNPTFPILLDGGSVQADALMVDKSNEVIFLDDRATIRCRGAIDDQYGYDFSRDAPRETSLRDAVDSVLRGGDVAASATAVAGCMIAEPELGRRRADGRDRVRSVRPESADWLDRQKPGSPREAGAYHRDAASIVQARCQG